jgi:glutathione S-transferase
MASLIHHKLDPACRLARLMLAEYGVAPELIDTRPWMREPALTEIDPAAGVPVLVDRPAPPVIGILAVIHAIEERYAPSAVAGLVPAQPGERFEMWRLLEWVMGKFNDEVTRYILEEKIAKRDQRGVALDVAVLRAAKANLAEHMRYFTYLLATRTWIAGTTLTLADFALAAHFSTLDYLGDIVWDQPEARDWYARIKSRPAFRTLLSDRLVGMLPHAGYADLDF